MTGELLDLARHYLAVRGYTLSTAHLDGWERVSRQCRYVNGEAAELAEAVGTRDRRKVMAEIADVLISASFLAETLDTTPEECIALKTAMDAGRGWRDAR